MNKQATELFTDTFNRRIQGFATIFTMRQVLPHGIPAAEIGLHSYFQSILDEKMDALYPGEPSNPFSRADAKALFMELGKMPPNKTSLWLGTQEPRTGFPRVRSYRSYGKPGLTIRSGPIRSSA